MGMEATEAYRATRDRITALLRGVDPAVADRRVPACPRWTVREVAAHLAGVCDDMLEGRLDGVATDGWTAAQVEARADRSLDEILDEWAEVGPRVEERFGEGGVHPQMLFDEVTHEHDVRGALDQPGARDDAVVTIALSFVGRAFPGALRGAGAPPLAFRFGGEELVLAGDELGPSAQATLTATAFDLVRSCSGRRTLDQIAALDWGGADPAPWLPAFTWGPFTVPATPVETPDAG